MFITKKIINDKILNKILAVTGPLDIKNGPWIAGGSARLLWYDKFNLVSKSNIHDIDIFVKDDAQFFKITKKIKNTSIFRLLFHNIQHPLIYETPNAVTYTFRHQFTYHVTYGYDIVFRLQVIKNYGPSITEIMDKFDLTVCKFATDGKILIADSNAIDDVSNNVLRINNTFTGKLNAVRVTKYAAYGFDPEPKIIHTLIEQIKNNELDGKCDY